MIEGEGGMIETGRATTDKTRDTWRDTFGSEQDELNAILSGAAKTANSVDTANTKVVQEIESGLSNPDTQIATLMKIPGMNEQGASELVALTGGDPKAIMDAIGFKAGTPVAMGNFLQDEDRGRKDELSALLDLIEGNEDFLDKVPQYNDLQAGETPDAYMVNEESVQGATALGDVRQKYGALAGDLFSFDAPSDSSLNELGITRAQYDWARNNGVDLRRYFREGPALQSPDLANLVGASDLPYFEFDKTGFLADAGPLPSPKVTDSTIYKDTPKSSISGNNKDDLTWTEQQVAHNIPGLKEIKSVEKISENPYLNKLLGN